MFCIGFSDKYGIINVWHQVASCLAVTFSTFVMLKFEFLIYLFTENATGRQEQSWKLWQRDLTIEGIQVRADSAHKSK